MLSIYKERENLWVKLSVVVIGMNGPQEAWPCWGWTVILGACKSKTRSEQDGKTHASVVAQSSVVQVALGFAGGVSFMSARNRPLYSCRWPSLLAACLAMGRLADGWSSSCRSNWTRPGPDGRLQQDWVRCLVVLAAGEASCGAAALATKLVFCSSFSRGPRVTGSRVRSPAGPEIRVGKGRRVGQRWKLCNAG